MSWGFVAVRLSGCPNVMALFPATPPYLLPSGQLPPLTVRTRKPHGVSMSATNSNTLSAVFFMA